MGEAAEPQTREGTAAPQPRAARGLLTERGARKDLRSSMKNPRSDRTWEVSHGEWRRWDTAFLWGWDAGPCPPAPQPHPIILDPVALTLGEAPCPFIPGSAQGDGHSRGAQAPGCVWGGRGGALGPCPPAAPPPAPSEVAPPSSSPLYWLLLCEPVRFALEVVTVPPLWGLSAKHAGQRDARETCRSGHCHQKQSVCVKGPPGATRAGSTLSRDSHSQ